MAENPPSINSTGRLLAAQSCVLAPAGEADTVLDEVLVTAQRRSQSAREVGVAITAVSGEELQTLRLQQPLSLSTVSPSLSTMNATTDSAPLFLIRGIGLDDWTFVYGLADSITDSGKAITAANFIQTQQSAELYAHAEAHLSTRWSLVTGLRYSHVRTTELGFKGRFFSDSLEIDAAIFDTDIHDRQSSLSLWAGPVGTQPLIAGLGSVPRSRIDGVESNIEWRPLAGLEVHLAATYLHARVTKTLTNDNGLALFTPVAAGQMLPDAPTFSGSWLVQYEHPVGGALWIHVEANDHYTGAEHPYLADPTTFGRGHSLGARIGVKNPTERWDTSLWVTNLTDARPLTYAYAGSEGQQSSYYQKPRSVGVHVTYAF